jgi:hypothetical protein
MNCSHFRFVFCKSAASLAFSLSLGVLAGCGGGGSSDTESTDPIDTTSEITTPAVAASECVASTHTVDIGTSGSLINIAGPVVAELKQGIRTRSW